MRPSAATPCIDGSCKVFDLKEERNLYGPVALTPAELETEQLLAWAGLSTAAKIDFFEEMIEIAFQSGALAPERLALRDARPKSAG